MDQPRYARKIIQKLIRIKPASNKKKKNNELRDSIEEELSNREEFELLTVKSFNARGPIASYTSEFSNIKTFKKKRKQSAPKPVITNNVLSTEPIELICDQAQSFGLFSAGKERIGNDLKINKDHIDYSTIHQGRFDELCVETIETGRSCNDFMIQNQRCETDVNQIKHEDDYLNSLAMSNQSNDSFKKIYSNENNNTDTNIKINNNNALNKKKNKFKGSNRLLKQAQDTFFDKEFKSEKRKANPINANVNNLFSESNDQPLFQAIYLKNKKKKIKNALNNLYLLNIDKENKNMSKIRLEDIQYEVYSHLHPKHSMTNQSYSRIIHPFNTKTNCSLITNSDKAYTMNCSIGIEKKLVESNNFSLNNSTRFANKKMPKYI